VIAPGTKSARARRAFAAWDRALFPLLLLVLPLFGCRRGAGEQLSPRGLADVAAPNADPDGLCVDLAAHRVCWAEGCPAGLCLRSRPIPDVIRAWAEDYRCTGSGNTRRCAPRAARAPRFRCRGPRCSQEQPRLPNDGEWECADLAGAVLCRGGSEPAGVTHANVDPGWLCGARRHGKNGERVCLDLDPDFPEKTALRSCHFEFDGARMRRICEASDRPLLGDACTHPDLCPAGSDCNAGVCIPPRPRPNCWGDADCELGQCRFGSCSVGAP
jgi:hypothetical protein